MGKIAVNKRGFSLCLQGFLPFFAQSGCVNPGQVFPKPVFTKLTTIMTTATPTLPKPTPASTSRPAYEWLFYPAASFALLVLTFIGFQLFYLRFQAFPGRELTPPIRKLVIVHGTLMSVWMLLAIVQPLLVAVGQRRVHMTLGRFGAILAACVVCAGYLVAINSARVSPPDLRLFGLAPKEFLVIQVSSMILFATFVTVGVVNRRRPEIHRPLMLMASLSVISAAIGRMPRLNAWYAGTLLERCFSAFLVTLIIGAVLLIAKWAVTKKFDRWFAGAFAALAIGCVTASLAAKTPAWIACASFLTQ